MTKRRIAFRPVSGKPKFCADMPHIVCGAEVYADSGLSRAGMAWKMTRLIDERMSNGKCGLHLGVNQCLVCCFIDGLLDCCDRLGSMERENLVASCKKLIAGWKETADEKWKKLILKKKILTEKWMKFTNAGKVVCSGIASLFIFVILFVFFQICFPELMERSAGLWNFIILVVSAPVAFAIWHFRDENNRQQIENQRKDINLKEFQKLSEWVSGAHLPEIKTVDKTTQKEGLKDKGEIEGELQLIERTTEKTEEYGKKPHAEGFDTFGKREGAVALQISAVYNLLPFFRGDYGESFRRPAFNLLKSAWQAMQQDSLKKWETANLSSNKQLEIFRELRRKAESPMGVALTHVLLSLNQKNTQLNLRDFPEMLPNLCLAGMNFHLSGVDEKARNWSGLNLSGVDFRGAALKEVQFEKSQLDGANLQHADLCQAKLQYAVLWGAELQDANLIGANLEDAKLGGADLQDAKLDRANLEDAKLGGADLQDAKLDRANLKNADLVGAKLQGAKLARADLRDAKLIIANMQNADLLRANLQGAKLDGADLQGAKLDGSNLQNADLAGANLQGVKLDEANLQGAKLDGADLRDAKLIIANLQNADLLGVNLQGARLDGANLQDADLRGCNLSWMQLEEADNLYLADSKITTYDFADKFYPEWKAEADSEWETLTEGERRAVMKKFHYETGVYIY
mgnify:CR=1 FL=1